MESPRLVSVEQVCGGWVKKHVLTYELPDGSLYEYHCATRRAEREYREELERNAEASDCAMAAMRTGAKPQALEPRIPDAVCVVARTPRDTLVMVREFRYPLNSWCVAFPAGLVDPGESVVACAARELREETGYEVVPGSSSYVFPQPGYSSTGLSDEAVQVVFVEAERAGCAHVEGSEFIEAFELPVSDARRFLEVSTLPIGTRDQLILAVFALGSSEPLAGCPAG